MSTFAFRAVDLAGVPARGEMEASSKTAVSEQLRQRGLIVLDIAEKREAFKLESILQRFKSVNLRAIAVFSRQFATLISSGMPMLRSLYTLEEQTEDEMRWPVTEPAHVSHEIVHAAVLMLPDKSPNRVVEIK